MSQEELAAVAANDPASASDATGRSAARPKPVAWALTFGGVVLPLVCFAASFPGRPDWQSGNLTDYAQLLLSHKCSAPLYPFLLYSMVCLLLVVWQPGRFSHRLLVRWGIYCGVLVAAEYWLIFQTAMPEMPAYFVWQVVFSLLAVLVPWGGWRIAVRLHRRGAAWRHLLAGALAIIAVVLAALFGLPEAFAAAVFICLWCSTPWALASYAAVAIGLVRGRDAPPLRFSLAQLLGLVAAMAAHLAAWRISLVWMLAEYAKLPTTAPNNCFVCTAAARGHQRVVRSEAWQTAGGTTYGVNDQLRTLKAFELLLLSLCPGFHWRCRWLYDRVGPRAAALLFHPLLADAGYFLLKPLEWGARVCLLVAIPGQMRLVRGLYRAVNGRIP